MSRLRLFVVLIAFGLFFAANVYASSASAPAKIGGAFTLTDTDGKVVHDTDFPGKYLIVYFGYTYCPDMCPTGLQGLTQALYDLGAEAGKIQPLFITIDPSRDTPEKMKQYVTSFHPSIIGLFGTPEQTAQVTKAYHITYAMGDDADGDDYLIDYTSPIFLMSPQGVLIKTFKDNADPAQLTKAIHAALAKAKAR